MQHMAVATAALVAISACAHGPEPNTQGAPVSQLIDLQTTPLRDTWTAADASHLMANERFLAYLDSEIIFFVEGGPAVGSDYERLFWSDWVAIVWQRRLTADDLVFGNAHPRDLDLTLRAYRDLTGHLLQEMIHGRIVRDPTWQIRFPELYHPKMGQIPWISSRR